MEKGLKVRLMLMAINIFKEKNICLTLAMLNTFKKDNKLNIQPNS